MFKVFYKWLRGKIKDIVSSQKQIIHEFPMTSSDVTVQAQLVPYDENLLECSRTQWQFGDWESLIKLNRNTLQYHPDRAKLALLTAAGHQQQGGMDKAHEFIRLAKDWGCSKKFITQVLIAGAHNTLGRANAIIGKEQRALGHFKNAIDIGAPGSETRLITQARVVFQLDQIRLPEIYGNLPRMLQLSNCYLYAKQLSIVKSNLEKQPVSNKYEALAFIHKTLEPELYLEIGVQQGKSLALATCTAIGIDPVLQERVPLGEKARIVIATSDEFFTGMADDSMKQAPDLVLIDGMQLIEYVLRDFMHVEQLAGPATLVVVANIYPKHTEQAKRRRQGADWIGDVWKLPEILSTHRPDLVILGLDVLDTGLLLIAGLDPENNQLKQNAAEIHKSHTTSDEPPPIALIGRAGSFPLYDQRVFRFLETVKYARKTAQPRPALNSALRAIFSTK